MLIKCFMQEAIELGILRDFEFVTQLRRASVIVRQFGDPGASVFVKGAPESVRDICLPESCEYIPAKRKVVFLRTFSAV
jgi:magnesium-transporting ATPase (P-type)